DLAIYSIDDKGTADIDDAISVELNEDKIILGIHISNVARFISKEGFLDNEAQNRGETVYFPEIVFDMFPHSLVEVKLTLNSGSKRLAISLFATFEKSDYKLVEYHFEQSIINVKKNLTYEEAEKTLTKTEWGKELIDLSMHLREKRIRNGAFIVQLPELKISFDENNEMSINKNYMISLPHKVVSECMILMNRLTAEYFKTNEIPALFRSQTQQIDEQAYELDPKDVLFPTKVTKFLKPTRVVLSSKPHKSLGIDCYVQVTSPIRRYMDVILQRQLIGYLTNGEICYSEDELESIFTKVSLNVREIKNSQKSRHRFWLLKHFLISDIKKAVGYVSSVKDKRASVYIPEFLMELPLSNFGGKKYKEGEKLEVEFYNIDPLRRRISIKPVIK
nr:RNB domain-containing ribonuclease [Candidatus Dadabacteria bacterium]NIQ14097.1 RNB domain-containing ribonuclease [Candidatus Dadabacteria bacterium]